MLTAMESFTDPPRRSVGLVPVSPRQKFDTFPRVSYRPAPLGPMLADVTGGGSRSGLACDGVRKVWLAGEGLPCVIVGKGIVQSFWKSLGGS